MPRRVSIIPHTHWDREWYASFQTFRLRLVEMLDELFTILDTDPTYAHFLLDGQVAAVDDYLAVRPESEERIRRLVRSGRLAIGPWYTLPDEFSVSGETLVRNLQMGIDRAVALGGTMEVGYLPDMFGHVTQMPQLLRSFGFGHAVIWRGVPAALDRSAFWWSSPDGSTVRAEYLLHGYGNGAAVADDAKALVTRVRALLDELNDVLAGDLLFMNGSDHQRAQPWLGRVVAEANELADDLELTILPLAEALEHSASTSETSVNNPLPRWEGELRSGARASLLMGVASNRVDVKQAAAAAERALERRAEPMCALWLEPGAWPAALLRLAWLDVLRNSAHDSVCACSIDDVVDVVLCRYAEARDIGNGLAKQAISALAQRQAQPGAIVVNATARARSGTVELLVPGVIVPAGGQLIEARPTVRDKQLLSPGDARSWLLWFRSPRLDEATYVQHAEITDGADAIELTLHCDEHLGPLAHIEDIKAEVRARLRARPMAPLHLHIAEPARQRVLWHVRDVPGFGWRRWQAEPLGCTPVTGRGLSLSNGLVSATIDATNATFTMDGSALKGLGPIRGLGRLVDSGDDGDSYNFNPPEHDVVVDMPEEVSVELIEQGPVRARARVLARYRWPERVDAKARARTGEVDVSVTTTIELHAGEPFVRVSHAWENRARDHRVRAVFPLPVPDTNSRAECAFAIVERGLHAEGGPTERGVATSFSRRFVSAGGLTLVHDGLLEYELTDERGRPLDEDATVAGALTLTLLRATGVLSRTGMAYRPLPAGPNLALAGGQLHKAIEVRYAVAAGDVDPYAIADDLLVPLEVVSGTGGGPEHARAGQALAVRGAEVSAIRRDLDARLTLRVFNPSSEPSTVQVLGRHGWVVDLRGRTLAPFDEQMALAPWQIATLRLEEPSSPDHAMGRNTLGAVEDAREHE